MSKDTIEEQLVKYLTDAHAIEEQALPQMRAAPKIVKDERLAQIFRDHLTETERHEQLTRERLEALGAKPSRLKDAVMKVGGLGFVVFAGSQPDTPGKLVTHALSYEHLELAAYELLMRVADRAGDSATAEVAREIREDERAMSDRLEASFDIAVQASLAHKDSDDLEGEVVAYLRDAHALEAQSIQLLLAAPRIVKEPATAKVYKDHLEESRAQSSVLGARLEAHGSSPSKAQDAALRTGALNWGAFFAAQPDTAGKLAAFAYAYEHLEIGGYELLRRVAERAGDTDTAAAVGRIVDQERAAAKIIASEFDRALDASLAAQGVGAT